MNIKFKRIRDVEAPTRGTTHSAGIDFYVPNDCNQDGLYVPPHGDILLHSGICVDMMCADMALIAFNKSGVAYNQSLVVGACVVDSDYQGEIMIHLINVSDFTQVLRPGQKIAQYVAVPILYPELIETDDLFLTKTERGDGGFGSTNKSKEGKKIEGQLHELTTEEQREYCKNCMEWVTPDDDDWSAEPGPYCSHLSNVYKLLENRVKKEGRCKYKQTW